MKKIPDNAKKVFEGIIFDVYHWDQEMFDGTIATFEAVKRKDSVTIIAVTEDGNIILNEEEQPGKGTFISLPGGRVDEGESILDAAKRELKEETGFVSNDWQEWFISDPFDYKKIEWNVYFYIARNITKSEEQSLDNGEKITTKFVSFDEFLELRNNPRGRNKDIIPILEKAASSEEEKQKLKALLGITPTSP